jgi:hypothetical protein
MSNDEDVIRTVRAALAQHVMSLSISQVRDPFAIDRLAKDIVRSVTSGNPVWRKWGPVRETVLKSASECWIPTDVLRDFLNEMPGPVLTLTDVKQRLRAMQEEEYLSTPDEDHRKACLTIIETERAQGTELPAIIGAVQEYLGEEYARRSREDREAWDRRRAEEKAALEERFISGADCKWTPVNGSTEVYCRTNGRAYRLSRGDDKLWKLQRVSSPKDEKGLPIGSYRARSDATKALAQVAYQPESAR